MTFPPGGPGSGGSRPSSGPEYNPDRKAPAPEYKAPEFKGPEYGGSDYSGGNYVPPEYKAPEYNAPESAGGSYTGGSYPGSSYAPTEQAGTQPTGARQSAPSPFPLDALTKPPSSGAGLPRILTLVVLALGVIGFLSGLLGQYVQSVTFGGSAGSSEINTSFFEPIAGDPTSIALLLVAALVAGAGLLPKQSVLFGVVAALSISGFAVAVFQAFHTGSVAGDDTAGFSYGLGAGAIAVLVLGFIQAVAAVAALLLSAGVLKAPAPRPSSFGQQNPYPGQGYGQQGPGQSAPFGSNLPPRGPGQQVQPGHAPSQPGSGQQPYGQPSYAPSPYSQPGSQQGGQPRYNGPPAYTGQPAYPGQAGYPGQTGYPGRPETGQSPQSAQNTGSLGYPTGAPSAAYAPGQAYSYGQPTGLGTGQAQHAAPADRPATPETDKPDESTPYGAPTQAFDPTPNSDDKN